MGRASGQAPGQVSKALRRRQRRPAYVAGAERAAGPRAPSQDRRVLGGYGVAQVVERLGARPDECFFWATHAGAELDLLVVRGRRRLGFEFKLTTAPKVTRSMRVAAEDLGQASLDVVHAGEHTFPLDRRIRALALSGVLSDLRPLA